MGYRKDIQLLRGVAVLMVVLFHLEMAGFSSGFLGVDVFFVISGYLMAQMYKPTDKLGFFAKRAKRLLPAYFAAVIATVVASMLVVAPNDYRQVADQAVFASFFASNIGYWLQNSYFNKEEFKPLLHLWSLGVEIQFYLLIPLLHWVFTRIRYSYGVVLLATAAACFVLLGISTKTAFFWMPFRMWEFLIGYGIARYLQARTPAPSAAPTAAPWLGALSLAGVLAIPMFRLDGAAMGFVHGHPGLMALVVSLFTGGFLYFGLPARWLANPVATGMEKLGDYSYSVYLAHFPVIVLVLYQPFSGTVLKAGSGVQTAVLVGAIALASAALYSLVEVRFRGRAHATRWIVAAAALALVLSPMGSVVQRQLVPAQDMAVYDAWFDRDVFRCGTSYRMLHPLSLSCEIGRELPAPAHKVLLVGNSHADSIKSTFSDVAHAGNVSEFFIADNSPLMPGGMTPQGVVSEARRVGADAVVLHFAPKTVETGTLSKVAALARQNGLKVALIMPVPVWRMHVPKMILLSRQGVIEMARATLADYHRHNSALIAELAALKAQDVKVYDTADAFCRPECQLMSQSGKPYYYDSGHLTLTGSEQLRDVFAHVIHDLE